MGFPGLGAVFDSETAHEHTQSKRNDMRHASYFFLSAGNLSPEASRVKYSSWVIE